MTDKSKPWLTAKHPEAIACKQAGKKLYDELSKLGMDLTGVGVGVSDDNQKAVIHIYLKTGTYKDLVPTEFDKHAVKTVITGVIRAL